MALNWNDAKDMVKDDSEWRKLVTRCPKRGRRNEINLHSWYTNLSIALQNEINLHSWYMNLSIALQNEINLHSWYINISIPLQNKINLHSWYINISQNLQILQNAIVLHNKSSHVSKQWLCRKTGVYVCKQIE